MGIRLPVYGKDDGFPGRIQRYMAELFERHRAERHASNNAEAERIIHEFTGARNALLAVGLRVDLFSDRDTRPPDVLLDDLDIAALFAAAINDCKRESAARADREAQARGFRNAEHLAEWEQGR